MFSISLRTLAIFRIGIGLIMLFDLFERMGAFRVHFTSHGVYANLPPFGAYPWFSIYHLSGHALYQGALFTLTAIAAFCFTIGYKTRIFGAISWFLLLNLQTYSFLTRFSADDVLRLTLFWSLFLPAGARYSVDARTSHLEGPEKGSEEVESLASAALLAQVAIIFLFAGSHKLFDPGWMAGTGVFVGLSAFKTQLAAPLLEHTTLLRLLSYVTVWVQTLAPLLLFTSRQLRSIGVVVLIGFQFSLALLMKLSFFPFIMIVSLILFLPANWVGGKRQTSPWMPRSRLLFASAIVVGLILPGVSDSKFGQMPTVEKALRVIGFGQNWAMFVPLPSHFVWLAIKVNGSDGKVYDVVSGKEFTDFRSALNIPIPAQLRWSTLASHLDEDPSAISRLGHSICHAWQNSGTTVSAWSTEVFMVSVPIQPGEQVFEVSPFEKVQCERIASHAWH